jgi:hypothetical protein
MRKAVDLIGTLERSGLPVLQGSLLSVFENLPYKPEFKGLLGLEEVMRFWRTAKKRFDDEPDAEDEFKRACRERWPEMLSEVSEVVIGPGGISRSEEAESLVASRAKFVLKLGRLSETAAAPFGCILIEENEGTEEIRTSQLTGILRAFDYRIPNASALIRSLADRPEPEIEILDRSGSRNELVFRLVPSVSRQLRSQLIDNGRLNVA